MARGTVVRSSGIVSSNRTFRSGERFDPIPDSESEPIVQRRDRVAPTQQAQAPSPLEPGETSTWGFSAAINAGIAAPVQLDSGGSELDAASVHDAAARGFAGSSQSLPYMDTIQHAFGPQHDLSGVSAYVGGPAAEAAEAIGASAYAAGNQVAFAARPSLHTAAHEAAHVVQQREGVRLEGGVGSGGDAYEVHADAVADLVVAGQSAAHLLDQHAELGSPGGSAVQRNPPLTCQAPVASGAPEHPPQGETIPPQYQNFPRNLARKVEESIALMVQHQSEFRRAGQSANNIWSWLDLLPSALIQTLIQSYDGAQQLGIWPLVAQIRTVYAGSSWGIEWLGNSAALQSLVTRGNFCEDPDVVEARFHPGPAHWWRHLGGGAGRRGMHVGVDAGLGFNNFHWDSNNPATERNNNPVVGAAQNTLGVRSDQLNTESCRYSPTALAHHASDVAGPANQEHDFPDPYIQFDRLQYGTRRVHGAANREMGDARAPQRGSLRDTRATLEQIAADVAAMEPRVRALSATPGAEHDPARGERADVAALRHDIEAKGQSLVQTMHAFAGYLGQAGAPYGNHEVLERIRALTWVRFTTNAADDLVRIQEDTANRRG